MDIEDIGNKYRFLYLLFSIAVGICLAGVLGLIIWLSRKNKDKNITYKQCFYKLIYPSIFTCIAICFLVILKMQYVSPVQLLIISAIFCSAIFSSIETKNFLVFLCLFILILLIIAGDEGFKWYKNKVKEIKNAKLKSPQN